MLTTEQRDWTMRMGDWMREERERAGLTRKQVAHRIGLAVNTVERWEQGARRPLVDSFLSWCRAVGVPLELAIRTISGIIPTVGQPVGNSR